MTRAPHKITRNDRNTTETFRRVSAVSPSKSCIRIPQKRNTEACFNPPLKHGRNTGPETTETRLKHRAKRGETRTETRTETRFQLSKREGACFGLTRASHHTRVKRSSRLRYAPPPDRFALTTSR
jgi:hypothetical protein